MNYNFGINPVFNYKVHFWPSGCRMGLRNPILLGLLVEILILRLAAHYSRLCKLRLRRKSLENFRKFTSQERHIRILIWSAYYFILTYSSNDNYFRNQKMSFCENRNYEFTRKIMKKVINILQKNSNDERYLPKP